MSASWPHCQRTALAHFIYWSCYVLTVLNMMLFEFWIVWICTRLTSTKADETQDFFDSDSWSWMLRCRYFGTSDIWFRATTEVTNHKWALRPALLFFFPDTITTISFGYLFCINRNTCLCVSFLSVKENASTVLLCSTGNNNFPRQTAGKL